MGYTGVLHTDSSYIGADITYINKEHGIQDKINTLRQRENQTYSALIPGCIARIILGK